MSLSVLTKVLTPAAVKNSINQQLMAVTSQKSHLTGDVTWHLFPRPGMKATKIHLDITDDKSNYNISIDNVVFNLQITALLRGQLIFNTLNIDGMIIDIQPDTQGDETPSKLSSTLPNVERNNLERNNLSTRFVLHNVLITNGQVNIHQPNNKIRFSDLQVGATQTNLKNNLFSLQLKSKIIATFADNNAKATLNYQGHLQLASTSPSQPLVALNHASINGQLMIRNLMFKQFKIDKITTNLKMIPSEILLNPLNISLYSGGSVGNIRYQTATKKLTINQTAAGLAARNIFKDLFANDLVKGTLDASIHATTTLLDNSWKSNLRGNGNLTIKNGLFYFLDLNQFTDQAINKLHSLLNQQRFDVTLAIRKLLWKPAERQPGNTKFQLLNMQYHLLNNKLINDSVILQTETLQLKASGQINFNDGMQDLNASVKLVSNDPDINKLQQLLGGSFPISICGTITKPQVLPNMQKLAPVISSYLLKNTLEYPVMQVKDHFKNILTTTESLLQ